MTNTALRYGMWVFSLTVIVCVANLPRVAAEAPTGPSPTRGVLEVRYDRGGNVISIEARYAPLGQILHEVSEKAGVSINSPKQDLLKDQISIAIERVPLEYALRRLLDGYNSTFFYSSTTTGDETSSPPQFRLDRVTLLSRKERRSPAPQVDGGLAQALIERKSTEARAITQTLKRPGTDVERERAVESLLRLLSDRKSPARHDAMVALKDLAPERAIDSLMNLLQDRYEDKEARMWAASLLGQIGDQRAVDLLMWAFTDNDSGVQGAAASGLARIGGERSVRFLLQVLTGSDRNLHRTAAMALAFHGDDKAKAALVKAINEGRLAIDTMPKDAIDNLVRRK